MARSVKLFPGGLKFGNLQQVEPAMDALDLLPATFDRSRSGYVPFGAGARGRQRTPELAFSKGLKSVLLVGLELVSESVEETAEKRELTPQGGAHSGAFSDCSSPTLAVLLKLAARLTAEDRGALARALQPPAG